MDKAKRRGHVLVWGFGLFLVGVVLMGAFYHASTSDSSGSSGDSSSDVVEVTYHVDSDSGSADVTLKSGNGGTVQHADDEMPGDYTYEFSPGDFAYVSAQNSGDGTVSCSIDVDGREITSNESDGEYAIVTCDGSA